MNISEISNPNLFKAIWTKQPIEDYIKDNYFLIAVQEKCNIEKISFHALEDSKHDLYLPIFLSLRDLKDQNMIKGKHILIADGQTIKSLLENHKNLKGITINPCKLDYKLSRKESLKLFNVDRVENFKEEFYTEETFTMADFKTVLEPRTDILENVSNYLKETTIKSGYIIMKNVGNKLEHKFIFDCSKRDEVYFDKLKEILNNILLENEIFVIETTKNGVAKNMVKNLKPFFKK